MCLVSNAKTCVSHFSMIEDDTAIKLTNARASTDARSCSLMFKCTVLDDLNRCGQQKSVCPSL